MGRMLAVDERHWWFVGRRAIVGAVLPPAGAGDGLPARVLDAGCGSGRTLEMLRGRGELSGIDLDARALEAARARGHADVRECAIEALPWPDATFGLVTCLDVIEHTDDDVRALAELRRVMAPGATLVTTVPAYPLLWSDHDEAHQHRRRYTRRSFLAAARAAGFDVVRDTYFNTVLFPPAAAVRLAGRLRRGPSRRTNYEMTPGGLDAPLAAVMQAEARLIGAGLRLPFGLSLLTVLRRPPA